MSAPRRKPLTASWFSGGADVVALDEYTVEIMTDAPNPLFPGSIANWRMMDSGWAMPMTRYARPRPKATTQP